MTRVAFPLAIAVLLALVIAGSWGSWPYGLLGGGWPWEAARLQAGSEAAERIGPCRVRRVIDGDTLDVRCGARTERVRLLRIDTPEMEDSGYREATRALAGLVRGRDVYLAFDEPGQPERGDHDRLLAYVYADGSNVNVEMVRQGWSPFWTRYGRGRYAREFVRAEREARSNRAGLWKRRD